VRPSNFLSTATISHAPCRLQDCIRIVWGVAHVLDRVFPSYDEHCARGPRISLNAKIVFSGHLLFLRFGWRIPVTRVVGSVYHILIVCAYS